jgi:hypothetical protein
VLSFIDSIIPIIDYRPNEMINTCCLKLFALVSILSIEMAYSRAWSDTIIPVDLDPSDYGYSYLVTLWIGTPSKPYRLRVTHSFSGIILYQDLYTKSSSYSLEWESDIVQLQDRVLRTRIKIDKDREISPPRISIEECQIEEDCDGFIGMGRGSFIWGLSYTISFGVGFLSLGDEAYEARSKLGSKSSHVYWFPCEEGSESNVLEPMKNYSILCGGIKSKVYDREYQLYVSMDSPYTYLPPYVYRRYTSNKNVFKDSENSWEPLKITTSSFKCKKEYPDQCEPVNHTIRLEYSDAVAVSRARINKLLVKEMPVGSDYIILGAKVISDYVIYMNHSFDSIALCERETHQNIGAAELVAIGILVILQIYWKTTHMKIYESDEKKENGYFIIHTQIFSTVVTYSLAFFAYFDRTVADIFTKEEPDLYIVTGTMLLLFMFIDLVMVSWIIISCVDMDGGNVRIPFARSKKINILIYDRMRNTIYNFVLLTTINLFLMTRRVYYITTSPSVIVMLYLIYSTTGDMAFVISFSTAVEISKKRKTTTKTNNLSVSNVTFN